MPRHEGEGLTEQHFHQGKKFPDPLGMVNPKNREVEVDLICEDPLIVAECTIHLADNNATKIQKFIRTVAFLENLYERKATAYVMCMDMDVELTADVSLMLKDKGNK